MPCFDFFWQRMEDVDAVRHHLQDTCAQSLQRLGRDVLPAALRQEQGVADFVLNTCGERAQDAQRVADPHDGSERLWRHDRSMPYQACPSYGADACRHAILPVSRVNHLHAPSTSPPRRPSFL